MRPIKSWFGIVIAFACLWNIPAAQSQTMEPLITRESARVLSQIQDHRRAPTLIYYAVDTAEPFMWLAIDTELRQLRASCRPGVNWIAILNSWIVASEPLLTCKDGELGEVIPDYQFLETIIAAASDPDVNMRQVRGLLRYHVAVTPENRPYRHLYASYPLVHADVMSALLRFVVDEVFSWEGHEFFLHLKGHGTTHLALTALDDETLNERVASQMQAWENVVVRPGLGDPLPTLVTGEEGRWLEPAIPESLADQLGLGRVSEEFQGASRLSLPGGLGVMHLGLSGEASPDNYFGISGEQFRVVAWSLSNVSRPFSAFTFIEACDSRLNANPDLRTVLSVGRFGHAAHYSATGTLWYRGLNWDELFSQMPEPAPYLQMRLVDATSALPNYHYLDAE